ncbi:hypothetical protein [Pseudonocardia sp. TRM90224]|uniref:hypothetical protein n=1 Tax=Pseudonocardia sp. TRM90224 TaxID=2812678 RepID=UPI001E5DD763|nr:hypothetical protein [Pseudonocardia sp. TRM90224]
MAIAVSAMELLRPESDLARIVETFEHVDLLVAAEDAPAGAPGRIGLIGGDGNHHVGAGPGFDESVFDDDDDDDVDEVRAGIERIGIDGLNVHRLGLRSPVGAAAESDLVAALSELVGFDPEPGVYFVAPAPTMSDQGRVVVNRAAQRIAQVYGLPLLRYRCLELSVVCDKR